MKTQVILTWLTTILENVIFSGAFFGWANIQPVLVDEGFFREGCNNSSVNSSVTSQWMSCKYQDESLGLVFTITSSVGLIAGLLVGSLLDRVGMWYTRTILINVAMTSYLVMATSDRSDVLYFTFPLINLAGFGMLLLNSQLNNLFAKHRSFYSTTCSGSFTSSSIVFLIFNMLHSSGYNFSRLIYFYTFIIFILNLRTFTLTPRYHVPYSPPQNYVYGFSEFKRKVVKVETRQEDDPDVMSLRRAVCMTYTMSGWWANVITQLTTSLYISTMNLLLKSKLTQPTQTNINFYTNVFGSLQSCSILFSPLGGLMLDSVQRRFVNKDGMSETLAGIKSCAVGFTLGCSCLLIMSASTLIPLNSLLFVSMIAQSLSQTFFFGVWNMFISFVYPSRHYGKIFGITSLLNGVGSLLQYPIILLLTRVLEEQFIGVNLFTLILNLSTFIHVIVVLRHVRER